MNSVTVEWLCIAIVLWLGALWKKEIRAYENVYTVSPWYQPVTHPRIQSAVDPGHRGLTDFIIPSHFI